MTRSKFKIPGIPEPNTLNYKNDSHGPIDIDIHIFGDIQRSLLFIRVYLTEIIEVLATHPFMRINNIRFRYFKNAEDDGYCSDYHPEKYVTDSIISYAKNLHALWFLHTNDDSNNDSEGSIEDPVMLLREDWR